MVFLSLGLNGFVIVGHVSSQDGTDNHLYIFEEGIMLCIVAVNSHLVGVHDFVIILLRVLYLR